MSLFRHLFGGARAERLAALARIRSHFALFRSLLDRQNQVLKEISDLEQRSQEAAPLEIGLLRSRIAAIQAGVSEIVEMMIALGGERYAVLRQRLEAIRAEAERVLPGPARAVPGAFIIPFDRLGQEDAAVVGGKNANLGEMRSHLGLPVPDGFAISASACRHFLEANRLREKIGSLIRDLRVDHYEELEVVSDEIRALLVTCPVPDDLTAEILRAFDDLDRRCPGGRFALRSSAIGEDTSFTFAGQYLSFLNVPRSLLLHCYREVLASKYTPAAIFYFLHHAIGEHDPDMGVGCMALVDASASGVIYTRDPLDPQGPCLLVHSVFGLGSYLVDGVLTPDVFYVSREERRVLRSRVARKPVRLVLHPREGVTEAAVTKEDEERPSLTEEELAQLAAYALLVEERYGTPQDLEWARDREGRLFLLQARPLRVMRTGSGAPAAEASGAPALFVGGTTVCPGAGGGPVFRVCAPADLGKVPEGAVLVSQNPAAALIAVMPRISALVTEIGGTASHMATLAREIGVPTLSGVAGATKLAPGLPVTVDASAGIVYQGLLPALIERRRRESAAAVDRASREALQPALAAIAHLNLVNPGAPEFQAENCRTLHDITRFIHQKAMEEMFAAAKRTARREEIGQRLRTEIPLLMHIVHLDRERAELPGGRWIAEEEIDSLPMRALWSGVCEQGWPARPAAADVRGFLAVMGTNISQGNQPEFSESSYAFLSHEYMLLNIRMGYHFATVEALVTPEPAKNYIRMQYKDGGAPLDRRIRRIGLIAGLLGRMGFENTSKGDFLDSTIAYQDAEALLWRLKALGRINILTKQLDMALTSEAITHWYTEDFARQLGLARSGEEKGEPGA